MRARRLRRNSTKVEMRLWQKLRNRQLGVDFRRQHPAGPFVLDFYCPSLGLVVELDGGQHNKSAKECHDRRRDAWLTDRGVVTLRFWNSDVAANLDGVLEVIKAAVDDCSAEKTTPTRRWRADLPLPGGGKARADDLDEKKHAPSGDLRQRCAAAVGSRVDHRIRECGGMVE
jgi:very-short-patch-repair endonuclease